MLSNEERKNEGNDKRSDIQCLRGIAIIYVLLFHLFPSIFRKGFLGVDIFFVISGYLITFVLSRHTPISLKDTAIFFSKRIRRIFPAYYLMVFAVIVFGRIYLSSYDQNLLMVDCRWTLAFSSNIHKYLQQKDYFAQIANYDFLLHSWSLAVEIQFYCLAPFLAMIVHRLRYGQLLVAIVGMASFVLHVRSHGELQFSSLPSRLWQFIAGAFAYDMQNKGNVLPNTACKVVAFLAFIAISPLILFAWDNDLIWRLVVTLAAAVIISRLSPNLNDYFRNVAVLVLVGNISYSLYLAHWPLIVFFRYNLHVDSLPLTECIIIAQLSFLIAYISFKTIETYFTHEILLKTFLFIIILLCISVFLMIPTSKAIVLVEESVNDFNATTLSPIDNGNETVRKTWFERDCFGFHNRDHRPENLSEFVIKDALVVNDRFMHYWPPDIPNDTLPDPLVKKHFMSKNIAITFTAFYEGPGKTKVAIFGNSFAHRALFAVVKAFGRRAKQIRLIANIGCPPFIGSTYPEDIDCAPFLNASVELLEDMKPDITFIIFRPFTPIDSPIIDLSKDDQLNNIQRTIDRISLITKRIVLEYPLPVNKQRFYTPYLIEHLLDKNPSFDDVKIDYSFFWNNVKHIFKRLDSVKCKNCDRIYTHKLFCDFKICRVFDPETLYSFFDMGSHYNDYAMKCFEKVYAEIADENYANGIIE
ncbi:O-acetyltransferase OatA [Toxocara canis]|uniref:O-acetyltransferase OatA n=1 Tax=Toxocara canis TaxID=6265 RepID=A0A0B2VFQ6_TOXCA|nr:O-acetyltransferase OatA [Toxocara canis]